MKYRLLALLLVLPASAAARDSNQTLNRPAASLVAPFANTATQVSFLLVSNVAGVSGTFPQVTTHWSYWSETCQHLGDVNICLTLNDTIIVDTRNVSSIGAENQVAGPHLILDNERGFVVVTAYQTDETCRDASFSGEHVIDDALTGSFTFADLPTGSSAGATMPGYGAVAGVVDLPDQCYDRITIPTFRESTLDFSELIAFTLEEKAGEDTGFSGELGPVKGAVIGTAVFYDNLESRTSLPDLSLICAASVSTLSRERGGAFPLSDASAGIFALENLRVVRGDESVESLGGTTGIVALIDQAVGTYGVTQVASVESSGRRCGTVATARPTPSPTPTPGFTSPASSPPSPTACDLADPTCPVN